jgi:hypothetical protein
MKRERNNRPMDVSASRRGQCGWQAAVRVLTAVALLLSSIFPSWHHARAKEAALSDLAELQLALGEKLADLRASICSHGDENSSEIPGDDETKLCKHCALCLAFQHFAAINPPRNLWRLAYGPFIVAVFLPHRPGLGLPREAENEARPRAPPLA